jgi:adenylyltransferase/sulfurtransferase
VHSHNAASLCQVDGEPVDLILDGTDNVATRYLLNDLAVKQNTPWVYSACVGTEGRVMTVRPGVTACLRCVFPEPPAGNELPTCDSAGVLAAAAAITGSLQVVAALRILLKQFAPPKLVSFDAWTCRFHEMDLTDSRRADCLCCGLRRFDFLDSASPDATSSLCGRDAVQVRGDHPLELKHLATKWRSLGPVEENRFFIRCRLDSPAQTILTAFQDGRLIVQGTRDLGRAKSLYAQFIGS